LKRLFEMEVPEIYDGTVQIKAAVREPGDRAKIAVISNERDVDPVGECVGMKGSRVQAIIRELRGERIDIIEWAEDPAVFAANALSPAKVSKVEINSFEEKKLTVTVPEDQLSLAIGKKGQNVRLAAKLVGWHIDIRSAEEAARAAAAQLEAVMAGGEATLTDIRDSLALDQITAERLKGRGIETIDQLALISVDELVDAIDVSYDQANEILERAHRLLAQKHAREAREAREAEEATAKAATENESGEPLTATAEGEESGAAEPAVEKLAEGFDAEEIGAEETTQTEALTEDERLAEEASEPAIEAAAPEEPVIAFEAAAEHETAAEVLPESKTEGAETESAIEERVEPEQTAAEDEPHKDE
jgi:N utilization substance protein A